jgi:hypothetical protein
VRQLALREQVSGASRWIARLLALVGFLVIVAGAVGPAARAAEQLGAATTAASPVVAARRARDRGFVADPGRVQAWRC